MSRILYAFLLLTGLTASAQSEDGHSEHHHNHRNELGIAASPVYFVNENEASFGLHVHYVRMIGDSKFGIGAGYERIFDDHEHQTFGILGAYRPVDRLLLSVSTGISKEKHSPENNFAVHFETSYEFEAGDFHLGPAFEIAYDEEDVHISLGVHIGLGF